MGEGADLPGHLRLVGRAAAAGGGDPGAGVLLGMYEGQPAPAELHIEPNERPTDGKPTERMALTKNIYLFIKT